jgi:predicted negative regulator of RcsB-dependent stress response
MSNEKYLDFILDLLEKGITERHEIVSKFSKNFQKSERTADTYLKKANEAYKLKRDTINKSIIEETIKTEKEAVKIIINSKLERLEIYQKQILDCVKELNHGFTEDMKNGELFSRPLNINEKSAIRRSIKDLQSEISKIEGDYATSKLEMSFNVGLDMEEEFE